MLENVFCPFPARLLLSRGGWVRNENKANSVQLQLQLPTGTELGKKRPNDGNNNDQAMHGARKPTGPKRNSGCGDKTNKT